MRLTQEEIDAIIEDNAENRPCNECRYKNLGGLTYYCGHSSCDFRHSGFEQREEYTKMTRHEKYYFRKRAKRIGKSIICLIILIGSIAGFIPAADADYGVSGYKDIGAMWELVESYSPNDYITAAVVSQIWFESNCLSNAVGGGYLVSDDYDERATAAIDAGLADGSTREGFTKHIVGKFQVWGYGLIQWVDPTECGKLFDYAAERGTSIADAETQIAFIFDNIPAAFPEVWEKLLACESAGDAGITFAYWVGGTDLADKLSDRAWMAEELYKEYAE